MRRVTRRQVLSSVGLAAGAGLLAGRRGQSQGSAERARPESNGWVYVELQPALVAERAYGIFPEGGCMYALTGSIIRTLGDIVGDPYRSFPVGMMRYGLGGAGGSQRMFFCIT